MQVAFLLGPINHLMPITQLDQQPSKLPDHTHLPANLPGDEAPCFTIRQLELKGDESSQFGWVLDALAGTKGLDSPMRKCIGAKGISVLLQRAQEALVAKGFVTTRIFAQPQDLAQGSLSFTVVPGRIGSIRWPATVNTAMQSAIPAQPGDILNLRDIEQSLENFKRVPTADADIQITPADAPNQSDLVIRYTQGFPLRASLSLDDSGNKSTGKYQASATVSWDNPLGLNDLFYLTTTQDAGGGEPGPRGTRGTTVHYSLPYGYWSLGTTFSDSRYSQTVVGTSQNYVYSGTSGNAEIKVARMVYRDALGKTTVHLKAFERHSRNFIDDTEVQVQRRAVGGWELGVGHKQFVGPATVDASLSYKRGTPDFASIAAPEEASGEGTSRFGLVAAEASLSWPFKAGNQSLRYNGQLRVQNNTTALTPQDRFSIGGRYTVRGFDGETSLSGERGYVLRNDLSAALGDSGQELYVGVDQGEVDGPSSDLLVGKRLSGAVIGLRGGFKKLQYDVFVGTPLYQPNGFRAADTSAGFSLNLSF
jgi:hemolysin activation/secretion protein